MWLSNNYLKNEDKSLSYNVITKLFITSVRNELKKLLLRGKTEMILKMTYFKK